MHKVIGEAPLAFAVYSALQRDHVRACPQRVIYSVVKVQAADTFSDVKMPGCVFPLYVTVTVCSRPSALAYIRLSVA